MDATRRGPGNNVSDDNLLHESKKYKTCNTNGSGHMRKYIISTLLYFIMVFHYAVTYSR